MKIVLILVSLAMVGIGALFLSNEDKRWVMFNGNDAEIYAAHLLNHETNKTPAKFINYSVSASDGYVIFSKHNDHSAIYGYFPTKLPMDVGGTASKVDWEPLGGKWFVSHP